MLFGSHRLFDYAANPVSGGGGANISSSVVAYIQSEGPAALELPLGSQAGDIIVYVISSYGGVSLTTYGYDSVSLGTYNVNPSQQNFSFHYKILTSADITSGVIGPYNPNTVNKWAITFRPSTTVTSLSYIGLTQTGSAGATPSIPTALTMSSSISVPSIVISAMTVYNTPFTSSLIINNGGTTGPSVLSSNEFMTFTYELASSITSARTTNAPSVSSTNFWRGAIFAIVAT